MTLLGGRRTREEYDLMVMGFLCGHWRTSLDWRKKAAEDQRGEGMERKRAVYLYRSSSRKGWRAGRYVLPYGYGIDHGVLGNVLFYYSVVNDVLFSLFYFTLLFYFSATPYNTPYTHCAISNTSSRPSRY